MAVAAGTAMYSVSSTPEAIKKEEDVVELPAADDAQEKTYNIVVKRDDAAGDPAEKVKPEVMLARMRVHATEVRRRGTKVANED